MTQFSKECISGENIINGGDLSMFLGRLFQGEKVEYDSPKNLLSDKKSVFYSMCKDAALVS